MINKLSLLGRSKKMEISYEAAVRLYMQKQRGAYEPVQALSALHGMGRYKFWVLRDKQGLLATVDCTSGRVN